jgi:hypothetical protein
LECGDLRRFLSFSFTPQSRIAAPLECGDRRRFLSFSFFSSRIDRTWISRSERQCRKRKKAADIAALQRRLPQPDSFGLGVMTDDYFRDSCLTREKLRATIVPVSVQLSQLPRFGLQTPGRCP